MHRHVSAVEFWRNIGCCEASPLAVSYLNCLQRICGMSLRDHVRNVDRCTPCLWSLSGKARGLGG